MPGVGAAWCVAGGGPRPLPSLARAVSVGRATTLRVGAGLDPRRAVPRTDTVLDDPRLAGHPRERARIVVREELERVRRGELAPGAVVEAAALRLRRAPGLRGVLNATGVVLHTNLGRAALSPGAVEAITAAAGHTDVE